MTQNPPVATLPMSELKNIPGRIVVIQQEIAFRFVPYKPGSRQAQEGIPGRWQAYVGMGRWMNALPEGSGWRLPREGEFPNASATEG